ncbi:MAG: signal peptidase II [Ruminococcaceae bacterium]|nr:signal peptidase II [Oscillospiraceae bacterium]MBQ2780565.1 signal peptidase II [Clostridia bacterium]
MILFVYLFIAAALVGVDQLTKYWAVIYLKDQPNIQIWPNVFELEYRENTGAAFSLFRDHVWLLSIVSAVILAAIVVTVVRIKLPNIRWVRIAALLIVAGGAGNLIDRVFRGYVVDFISVKLIDFPVFNVADCFVCIGAFVLLIYVIFIYREPAKTDTNA